MRRQPGAVVIGAGMLAVGLWVIAATLYPLISGRANLRLAGMPELWPLLPALIGIAMLVQAAAQKDRQGGLVFLGVNALLLGLFFCLFTLKVGNLAWRDLARLWPVFPVIVGFAFLIVYVTDDMRNQALLIPVYVVGGLGLFALPFSLGVARSSSFAQALQLWPLLAILIALLVFFRPRPAQARKDSQPPTNR